MKKFKTSFFLTALTMTAVFVSCGSVQQTEIEESVTIGQISDTENPETDAQDIETVTAPETDSDVVLSNRTGFTNLNSFNAKTIDGGDFTNENLSDKDVTAINIWSTTCPPCISEMPDLAEFEKSLPDNVQLVTWCLDGDYYNDSANNIISQSGYEGITITSGDGDLLKLLPQIMYTPTTIFVDSNGNIIGDYLVGSGDVENRYKTIINTDLKAMGKEELV